jgi:hypothetical protein
MAAEWDQALRRWMEAGLLLVLLQAGVLPSLGAVMLVDRVRRPRARVRTAPYDPELPIRGRQVSLQRLVPAPQFQPGACGPPGRPCSCWP